MTTKNKTAHTAVELRACPFCGSDATAHGWQCPGFNGAMSSGSAECMDCDAMIWRGTEAEAIAAWNALAALEGMNPDAIADVVAALRELMETHDEDENMDNFPDEDSVGWGQDDNGESYDLPLTFGHLRRARKALAKLEAQS